MTKTLIQVTKNTREKLINLKKHIRETYDTTINRMIDLAENNQQKKEKE